jgi:cell division protein FtsB
MDICTMTDKSTPSLSTPSLFSCFCLPWWAVGLVLLFLALAFFGERGVLRVMEASRHRHALEEQVRTLDAKNASLKKEIKALRSNKRYIEDIAREELGMVGDDEVVFVFPRVPANTSR